MANYLDYLYQMQGIQPGLFGNASNLSSQMLQNGAANTQALMQANDRIRAQEAQDAAAAAQGLQKANADEQARKQRIMQLGLMFATGGAGGEAAAPEIAEGANAAEIEGALATAAEGAEAGAKALEAAKAADAVVPAATGPSLLPGVGEKGAGMSFTPTGETAKAVSNADWFTKNKEWLIPLFGNMALR